MKRVFVPLYVVMIFLSGCVTKAPYVTADPSMANTRWNVPAKPLDAVSEITVLCKKDYGTCSQVLATLRMGRARDVTQTNTFSAAEIRAYYYRADHPADKLVEIAQNIENVSGVYEVDLQESHRVIRQAR